MLQGITVIFPIIGVKVHSDGVICKFVYLAVRDDLKLERLLKITWFNLSRLNNVKHCC